MTDQPSWHDDTPATDEQIETIRRDLDGGPGVGGAAFSRHAVRKLLAAYDEVRLDRAVLAATNRALEARAKKGERKLAEVPRPFLSTAMNEASPELIKQFQERWAKAVAEWWEFDGASGRSNPEKVHLGESCPTYYWRFRRLQIRQCPQCGAWWKATPASLTRLGGWYRASWLDVWWAKRRGRLYSNGSEASDGQ